VVPDLVQFARDQKWDFVSLTDHNTVSGLPQHESLAGDDLLTMGGLELTTYYGHAVVQGTRNWFEWRIDTEEKLTMPEIAQRVLDSGALFITAHPMAPGDPECSGCHWEFEDIWNGAWRPHNQLALDFFYQWLNEGHRLVATSGSDMHGIPTQEYPLGAVNVVYADELSEAAILQAIRKGHSYLSTGPELLLTGRSQSGVEVMVGDKLPDEAATIQVRWSGANEGDVLRFIVDGRAQEEKTVGASGEALWNFAPNQAKWCTVELRNPQKQMLAITNPIFFAGHSK
jgi:hypothetical protein